MLRPTSATAKTSRQSLAVGRVQNENRYGRGDVARREAMCREVMCCDMEPLFSMSSE
jgi:hypothetical protein